MTEEKIVKAVVDHISSAVAPLASRVKALECNTPKDGKDGSDGKDGASAEEVAALFERRFSDMLLSFERRFNESVEKAIDKMPKPKDGENGRDAIPVDGLDIKLQDDMRTILVTLSAGDTNIERSIKIPAILDRGVYKSGQDYEQGDLTTYGGSAWIAQKDGPQGSPGSSSDWRLAVKKGRDGKDLRSSSSSVDPSKGVKI